MPADSIIRVLVVEDNPGDYFLVEEYLRSSGEDFHSVQASHLTAAVRILDEEKIDVILLDLSLPDSKGLDTLKSIAAADENIPVIVLTGYADRKYGIESLKFGAQDYLVKDEINASLLNKSILYSIERNRVRKEITKQDRLFRVITENSNDARVLINQQGDIQFATYSVKKLTGFEVAEYIGKNERDLVHPDDVAIVFTHIQQAIKNENAFVVFEVRVKHKDGYYIWVKKSIVNLLHDELVQALVCTFWDVTKEKEAEDILRTSEERYRNLFEMSPAAIIIWDPVTMKVLEVNSTAEREYGYPREEFKKLSVTDYRSVDQAETIREIANRFRTGQNSFFKGIWPHLTKSGEVIYMDYDSHLITYNGNPAVLALGENVTKKLALEQALEMERKQKQDEIADAVIAAQEKERRELGQELHDNVNQILAGARLYLGLVRSHYTDKDDSLGQVDDLIQSAITEIRNLSHSLIPPSLEEDEFLESVDEIINMMAGNSGIVVEKQIKGINLKIIPDKLRLTVYRIIQEQFNNILKYSKASTVYFKLLQVPNQLLLTIKDDGMGCDLSAKSKGVGLMNIKTRASLFNGEVKIISAPGEGFELSVCFNFL